MPENDTKKCPFCGEEILVVAIKCKHCGSDLSPKAEAGKSEITNESNISSNNSALPTGNASRPIIPTYLAPAILTTVFCCLPFGIPAIVYAAQVNSKILAGDTKGALDSSKRAKMWSWITFAAGLLFLVCYLVFCGGFAILATMLEGQK